MTIQGIENFLDTHNGAITALATIVVALATILVAAFTVVLAFVTRSQARLTRALAESGAIAAKAARKSAEVAEKSVNDVERPYVLVEKIDPQINVLNLPDAVPSVELSLRNYGRSPALIRELRATLEISPHAKPCMQNWPFVKVIPLPTITVIGANQFWPHTCSHERCISSGEAHQIKTGTLYFWCYCTVFYDDVLDQHYETRMRFRYDPKRNTFSMLSGDEYISLDRGTIP
jgi:hypothetical protein